MDWYWLPPALFVVGVVGIIGYIIWSEIKRDLTKMGD